MLSEKTKPASGSSAFPFFDPKHTCLPAEAVSEIAVIKPLTLSISFFSKPHLLPMPRSCEEHLQGYFAISASVLRRSNCYSLRQGQLDALSGECIKRIGSVCRRIGESHHQGAWTKCGVVAQMRLDVMDPVTRNYHFYTFSNSYKHISLFNDIYLLAHPYIAASLSCFMFQAILRKSMSRRDCHLEMDLARISRP